MGRPMTEMEFEGEINKLAALPREELVERWVALYRTPPPKGLGQRLLATGELCAKSSITD